MDEAKFESRYEITEKDIRKVISKEFLKQPIVIIFNLIYIVFFIYTIWLIVSKGIFSALDIMVIVLVALVPFWALLPSMNRPAKQFYEQMEEKARGKKVLVAASFTDLVSQRVANHDMDNFTPDQICRFAQTKNFIALGTKAKQYVFFRKDSFTSGTPEEFKTFLREKYPNCKLK